MPLGFDSVSDCCDWKGPLPTMLHGAFSIPLLQLVTQSKLLFTHPLLDQLFVKIGLICLICSLDVLFCWDLGEERANSP